MRMLRWMSAAVPLAGVFLAASPRAKPATMPPGDMASRPECPLGGAYDSLILKWYKRENTTRDSLRAKGPSSPKMPFAQPPIDGQLAVSGMKTNIVEYHDCQALIVKHPEGLEFSSLFAIFASEHLDDSVYRVRLREQPRPVGNPPTTPIDPSTLGIPMAVIFSYDSSYGWLHLRRGFNCLHFFRDTHANSSGWRAKITWVNDVQEKCADPLPANQNNGNHMFTVTSTVRPNAKPSDYPPVANPG